MKEIWDILDEQGNKIIKSNILDFQEIENKHKVLIEKAINTMKLVEDPKHSLSHVLQVVEYTKEILKSVEADNEVCIISAYWHDVGRLEQDKGHALISANLLKKEMEELNYDEKIIDKCYKAVYKHGWKEEPETIEGVIIRDADKIDFVGIGRWEECIKTNCKFRKILDLLPTMRKDLLKLDASKEIFDKEIGKLVVFLHNRIFKEE